MKKQTKHAAPEIGAESTAKVPKRRVPQYKLTKADRAEVLDYHRRRRDYRLFGAERPDLPRWARIPSQGPGESDAMFAIRADKWRAFGKWGIEQQYKPQIGRRR
jgi:hypothetical protein